MQKAFDRWFLSHPRDIHETYGEHFRVALSFALLLLGAGLAALVHAIIPALFKTTASTLIRKLHDRISNRVPGPPKA